MEAPVLCRKIYYCFGLQPPYHGGLFEKENISLSFLLSSPREVRFPNHSTLSRLERELTSKYHFYLLLYQSFRGPGGAI
jgi:hypothetical protein